MKPLWQPFRWDALAACWPLVPGEVLVTVQAGRVQVLRQALGLDALPLPAATHWAV